MFAQFSVTILSMTSLSVDEDHESWLKQKTYQVDLKLRCFRVSFMPSLRRLSKLHQLMTTMKYSQAQNKAGYWTYSLWDLVIC